MLWPTASGGGRRKVRSHRTSKNNALNVCVMTGAVSRILSAACARRYKGGRAADNDIGTISYAAHTAVISPPSHRYRRRELPKVFGFRRFRMETALTKLFLCAERCARIKERAEEVEKNSTHLFTAK
jgi:hypothetical protein